MINRKARYNVICFLLMIIIIIGCDPAGPLIFKDNLSIYQQGELEIRFEGYSFRNSNFRLAAYVKSVNNITIYADSLKLSYKGSTVDYRIYFEGKRIGEEKFIFDVNNDSIIVNYGFDLNGASAGEEIKIYAKNYIKQDMKYIDLDTLTVIIPKLFLMP